MPRTRQRRRTRTTVRSAAVQTANATPLALTKITIINLSRLQAGADRHDARLLRYASGQDHGQATEPETGDTQEQTRVGDRLQRDSGGGAASIFILVRRILLEPNSAGIHSNNLQTAGVMPNMVEFLSRMPGRLVVEIRKGLVRLQSVCSSRPACSDFTGRFNEWITTMRARRSAL